MKKVKILGLIALVMVIGFFAVSCDESCDHAEDKLIENVITPATLTAEGEREIACECGEIIVESEVIPKWEALFDTYYDPLPGGNQYLRITKDRFQVNISAPANAGNDKFDFRIDSWAPDAGTHTPQSTHLTYPVVAFKVTGAAIETAGNAYTAEANTTEFVIYASLSEVAAQRRVQVCWPNGGFGATFFVKRDTAF